jgi:uncharacterized protein YegL
MAKTAAEWAHRTNLTTNGMPRLPVFFCLDTSASMNTIIRELSSRDIRSTSSGYADGRNVNYVTGSYLVTRLDELKRGLEMLYEKLMSDYLTKYSVEISIITFDDVARCHLEISNLADVNIVRAKDLRTRDNTCMGEGLNMTLDILEECLHLYQEYGVDYYIPWLIIMSDGDPNGREAEMQRAVNRIRDMVAKSNLVITALGVGESANRSDFSRLVPNNQIIMLRDAYMNKIFDNMIEQAKRKAYFLPADEAFDVMSTQNIDIFENYTGYGDMLEPPSAGSGKRVKIMFAGASPRSDRFIRTDVEVRAIQDKVTKTKYRDTLSFISQTAMRASELQESLRKYVPDIIHFSGHGTISGDLEFESDKPEIPIAISPEIIAETIRLAPGGLKLAFFNACHSVRAAQSAVRHVSVAIGMDGEIDDESAKVFAAEFYGAIGDGLSVAQSYEQAINQLNIDNMEDANIPKLFAKSGVDPSLLVFTK